MFIFWTFLFVPFSQVDLLNIIWVEHFRVKLALHYVSAGEISRVLSFGFLAIKFWYLLIIIDNYIILTNLDNTLPWNVDYFPKKKLVLWSLAATSFCRLNSSLQNENIIAPRNNNPEMIEIPTAVSNLVLLFPCTITVRI